MTLMGFEKGTSGRYSYKNVQSEVLLERGKVITC